MLVFLSVRSIGKPLIETATVIRNIIERINATDRQRFRSSSLESTTLALAYAFLGSRRVPRRRFYARSDTGFERIYTRYAHRGALAAILASHSDFRIESTLVRVFSFQFRTRHG